MNETLLFDNHTQCECTCIRNANDCSERDIWDPGLCRCVCKENRDVIVQCDRQIHYQWNSVSCLCECDRTCVNYQKMFLNKTSCTCECKQKMYKKCGKRNKLVNESNCKCMAPGSIAKSSIYPKHATLSLKWVTVIVVVVLRDDVVIHVATTNVIMTLTSLPTHPPQLTSCRGTTF